MEQDLADLRAIRTSDEFTALLNRRIDEALTEDFWVITLPNDLATSASRSPSLFAYYAALQLLDARVLFSTLKVAELLDPALKAKKAAVERHHLFPKAYLAKQGIVSERDTNQTANYALVEWADNISISDDAPAEYYPKYMSEMMRGGTSSADLDKMQYWHALPDGWYEMPYQQFLIQRRQYIAQVIRKGFAVLSG